APAWHSHAPAGAHAAASHGRDDYRGSWSGWRHRVPEPCRRSHSRRLPGPGTQSCHGRARALLRNIGRKGHVRSPDTASSDDTTLMLAHTYPHGRTESLPKDIDRFVRFSTPAHEEIDGRVATFRPGVDGDVAFSQHRDT